jgi:hypothetical protein
MEIAKLIQIMFRIFRANTKNAGSLFKALPKMIASDPGVK